MMAISAITWGTRLSRWIRAADCPASRVAEIIVAPYNDVDALRQLAERCDILTYEFENVDADGLDAVTRMDNSLKGPTYSVFLKIGFLKRAFCQTRLKSLWHLIRL